MRAGINILTIIIPIGIVLAVTIIAFAVYKAAYKRKINKRLAEGREADIKPMMSPVKFVVITLICSSVGLVIIWGLLILFLTARLNIDRLNMMKMPSVRVMSREIIEESPFVEYNFGDEIKGYTRHTFVDKDAHLEVYTVTDEFIDILPSVMVAAKYTGSRNIAWSKLEAIFKHNCFSAGLDHVGDSGLVVINTGGYHGKFTLKYNLIYENGKEVDARFVDLTKELELSVNEQGQIYVIE